MAAKFLDALKPVYTIIVTYNGMAWIAKCLSSLVESSHQGTIIIIDNCSTDGTVPFIRKNFPQVRLEVAARNLGFGQANNIGIGRALAEGAGHVFLLNQDTRVEPGTIKELVAVQAAHPEYGILSPLHLNGPGSALDINFAGYLQQSDLRATINSWMLGLSENPSIIDSPFVNAAAWMVSAACLQKTGGFDPIFFHYGEDENYAQRVLFHGFRIGIYTGARIYHDREQRPGRTLSPAARLTLDKNLFLNQACDIRKKGATSLILRRMLRYSLLAAATIFDKEKRNYYFGMAKSILLQMSAIRKSRKSAIGNMPFLPANDRLSLATPPGVTFEVV